MSITTLTNLSLNNQYYLEAISRLQHRRQTRSTIKLIHQYDLFIRNNLYDQVRIITEIYYKNKNNSFNHYTILNKFKNNIITNTHFYYPITDQEIFTINAFYDTIYNTL